MKTVEDIVREKKYFELTPDEKALVSEIAKNEEEYDQLQYLLVGSNSFFNSRKVGASSEMRDHIMEKLYPPTHSSVKWYQAIWSFLFPAEKSFYQYPAFQLVGVLLVFVGFFTVWQNPLQRDSIVQNVVVEEDLKEKEGKQSIPLEREDSVPDNDTKLIKEESVQVPLNENQVNVLPEPEPSKHLMTLEEDLEEEPWDDEAELSVPVVANEVRDYFSDGKLPDTLEDVKLYEESSEKYSVVAGNANSQISATAPTTANFDLSIDTKNLEQVEIATTVSLEKKRFKAKALETNKEKDQRSKRISVTEIKELEHLFFEVK